jgi:hypothetical protein
MRRLMILCWLAVTAASGLRAQPSSSPPGAATDARAGEFWIVFALSGGIRSPVCAACNEEHHGYGVEAGLGFSPLDNLRVGGSTFLFLDGNGAWDARGATEGKKIRHMLLQLVAHYYPWRGSSWFVGAGIGSASFGAYNRYTPAPLDADRYPLDSRVYGSGVGITLTVGNEVRFSPSVDLILGLNALFGTLPELTLNDRRLLRTNASMGILYISAGIRIHGGG